MDPAKDAKKVINVDLDDSDTNDSNPVPQPENISSESHKKKNVKKMSKTLKELTVNDNTKFMSNFDPEQSNRERRKLTRKIYTEGKKNNAVYDENGILTGSEKDVCDCLIEGCLGCHFPCPKCRSYKCGFDCRVNRKWMYEAVESEGAKDQS